MAHKPPINLSEIKKTGILKEDRFYKLVSSKANYVNEDTIKIFYMALVKTITNELREYGVVRLPHLGDIALVKQKDRVGIVGRTKQLVKGAHMLKFYFNRELKEYFNKFAISKGEDVVLDPRAKVLGKDVTNE